MPLAPYFERLSEAYAVIDGIPDHQITLDIEQVRIAPDTASIGINEGRYIAPTDWDALILTPDIWLSLCPPYIDIVLPLLESWGSYGIEAFWRIEGRTTSRFEVAMAHLFNVTEEDAEDLFGMRSDEEADSRTDKQVFLDRICAFLANNGQELTVGSGYIDQDEVLEHGISLPEKTAAKDARAGNAKFDAQLEKKTNSTSGVQTGFAALALENNAPGPETFDTEAAGTTVNPINQEQAVGPEDTPQS